MSLRVRVNPIACDARGLCVEALPEVFRFDDWGYPIVDVPIVPSRLERLTRMAADGCPTLAIVIEEAPDDGR